MFSPILADTTATTMPSGLGTAVTFMTEQIGGVMGIVATEPLLLLGVAMWCIGGAIGLFKRLV